MLKFWFNLLLWLLWKTKNDGAGGKSCEETHGRTHMVRCVGWWQSDGPRHVLKDEFQECGDRVEV